ncbi:PaaI family thioesterase [Chelatococcus asaccharovorans]|uniref:PaaI family thioesterase n=1 Tax=Chelatococcus asaccharovorans TaxID=28210 RepID=UPI00224C6FEC|nr:PaaI family thioesterase [Chelatococcus asaccharovorans]CAH1673744.1 putative enzyme [Chelatococcus asaccharovorans]CAH1674853.1 putative enzyme [Chelatococcus asaccharovorans]
MSNEPIQSDTRVGAAPPDIVSVLSGLDFLQRMGDGRLPPPPIAELLGFAPQEIEAGRAVFVSTPDARHYNPIGSVHGGYAATLLDSCMACAVHSMLKAGQGYTTVELKVNFVRPLFADTGEIRAEGKIIHVGRQIASAEGRLTDARGRLLAHATTTCLVFSFPASQRAGEAGG